MAAAQVLALYRQLLRLAKKWPLDEKRPGRALQPFLVAETKATFRNNRYVADLERAAALIAEILRDFRSNVFMKEYPIREQPIPDMAKRALRQMSKEAEKINQPERFGPLSRLKALFGK